MTQEPPKPKPKAKAKGAPVPPADGVDLGPGEKWDGLLAYGHVAQMPGKK